MSNIVDFQKKFRPVHVNGKGWVNVVGVAMGWTVRGSNPYGAGLSLPTRQTLRPFQPPLQCSPDPSVGKMDGERCRAEIAKGLELYNLLLPVPAWAYHGVKFTSFI
jgi:hypothetical protein